MLSKFIVSLFLVVGVLKANAQFYAQFEHKLDVDDGRSVLMRDSAGNLVSVGSLPTVFVGKSWQQYYTSGKNEMTRLRNAVYVTYPFALRAGQTLNEINTLLTNEKDEKKRKEIIKSREKDLRNEFTTPLKNLSVYQGKVLMKLINRQTGNNCFEIIKEFKGGVQANLYQSVAFIFGSSLKQRFDPTFGDDVLIEKFVQEIEVMAGLRQKI